MALLASSTILVGCAATTSGDMLKALEVAPAVPVPVRCDSTTCKQKWERAQVWLAKHSQLKIQTATDVQLATFNSDGSYYGFTVIKEPVDSGRYSITLSSVCGGGAVFPCSPKQVDVHRAFYYYVETGTDVLTSLNLGIHGIVGIHLP